MRILDMLKKVKPVSTLLLDENATSHWAQQLAESQGIDEEFKRFSGKVEELKSSISGSLRKFTDEDVLAAVPDRARTLNALHGKEYASQVNKLLAATQFTSLFTFERAQDTYLEAHSTFKDQSSKHISVLKEFLHDELKETSTLIQELEDTTINFMKTLEERKFPQVRKLHETNTKLQQMLERQEKYQKLLTSLETDLKRTRERRAKLEADINEQQALIRKEESLQALDRIQRIDERLYSMATQYTALAQDLAALYRKYPALELKRDAKRVIDELPKDACAFISGNAELIKRVFEDTLAQVEEERPGNVKTIVERLGRLGASVEQDAREIQTSAPDQRALKKEMMRDIAALNIYDKRQFLMRAKSEEESIGKKMEYLTAELDPDKRLEMEREMKDIARSLGAVIKPKDA